MNASPASQRVIKWFWEKWLNIQLYSQLSQLSQAAYDGDRKIKGNYRESGTGAQINASK